MWRRRRPASTAAGKTMRRLTFLAAVFVALPGCGPSHRVDFSSLDTFTKLAPGTSLATVQRRLGVLGAHILGVELNGEEFLLVRFYYDRRSENSVSWAHYVCRFRN